MAEFKHMTVQALRDLARKALGRGHSRLKTKDELIEALQAAERKVTGAAGKAASKVRAATGRAARATDKMVAAVRSKGSEASARRKEQEAARAKEKEREKEKAARSAPARKEPPGRAAKAGQAAREAARSMRDAAGAAARAGARRVRAAVSREPEPDPEGYMVARVAGEEALRGAPHPMTESALESARGGATRAPEPALGAEAFDERLGELPWSYADDTLMALARDPRTLFLYWDHAQETLRQAFEGLEGGRAQLWVFVREPDGRWERTRALDFALESRSYYVHDLAPGRIYRAEIHVVDRHGRDRLVPRPSNEMMLPAVGPSPIVDDRFMRIPWGESLQRMLREAHPGGPFPDDIRAQLARLSDWSRFAGRVWGGSAGGMGGRPFSAVSSPSAPSSPTSPWGRPDEEGR